MSTCTKCKGNHHVCAVVGSNCGNYGSIWGDGLSDGVKNREDYKNKWVGTEYEEEYLAGLKSGKEWESEKLKYNKEYNEGCSAADNDYRPITKTKCPYEKGTSEYDRWKQGYSRTSFDIQFWASNS